MNALLKEHEGKIPAKLLNDLDSEITKRKLSNSQVKEVLAELEKRYLNAQISPGEAIGIITAESFGEPSTQMSLLNSSDIILKIKENIKIMKIGKFVDYMMMRYGSLKVNDSEILPLKDFEIFVPSLNKKEKIEWKKVVECSRHKTDKKLLKLVTKSGRSITATDNHSFVVREENEIIPIVGRDLKLGDRIPVMSYLPENCVEEIRVNDYLDIPKNSIFPIVQENDVILRSNTKAKPIPQRLELDNSFGWFIGAYLSEGNATNGQVNISNTDDSFIFNLNKFVSKLGLEFTQQNHQRGFSFSRDLKINSSLLANFIKYSCNTGSKNKRVPDFAYSAKEEFVSGLLRGYFDGDGNFTVKRKMIRASSNSEEMIKGIALLLTRFKIFSYITHDKKGQTWLLIPYKYAPLFLEKIGSDVKLKALEELAEKAKKFWDETSNDYNDMISGFSSLFYDVAKKVGMRTRYINNFTKRKKIGRTTLFRYMKKFELLAKEKNVDISKELEIMGRMFYSDVIWDEIVNMEYVDNDDCVYDLSVPGLETFTTFDGIVTHNTLNTFHFAGVAEVNVTLGLPRLIEIFDARKKISTPMMEIHIEKQYNKDENKVRKIAAMIKETRLEDVASEFAINLIDNTVEVELNKSKMRLLNVDEEEITKLVDSSLKDVTVRRSKLRLILSFKGKDISVMDVYKLKENVKGLFIRGVKGITHVLPIKSDSGFMIITAGSNLKDILELKEVDKTRTKTNDLFEIGKVLGIEAARQAIIEEASKVITDQGLDVDIRHIMFISDLMTTAGIIKGITRSGITGEKESVLARASFETPIRHLVRASLIGEVDELNSVIENVMLNQAVPLGTGLPDLVARMDENLKKGEVAKKKK